jgi:hypothetical protein
MRNEPLDGLVARRGYQCGKHYTCARRTIAEAIFGIGELIKDMLDGTKGLWRSR